MKYRTYLFLRICFFTHLNCSTQKEFPEGVLWHRKSMPGKSDDRETSMRTSKKL